ncbi:hypothetical protein [Kribbella sp. VKM Ac-2566]|uniref:hypothetical protein n=1 Tax=Kribbella sp. VKM Ac-2566 TaxID=2512218 RepID=UPI00106342F9|nr:hypothetical protein [Kribbella sp. VKM Ac-2566]TDW91111.1 hypothetical protein EV647_4680 [Kribbella sp. VKM Ac-2566]
MTQPIPNQIPSKWRCVECDTEIELAATTQPGRQDERIAATTCSHCGGRDFEQSGGLTLVAIAIATLAMAGITPEQWIEASWYGYVPPAGQTLTWTGDLCGCTDDRCANGFHHMGLTDCGCLPVLIEDYLSNGSLI